MDLMTDLLAPVNEIRNLHEADKLGRKVFKAWGALQCMPELTVSFFLVFIFFLHLCLFCPGLNVSWHAEGARGRCDGRR